MPPAILLAAAASVLLPCSVADPAVHLVTFAEGEPYASTQRLLHESISVAGISTSVMWSVGDLQSSDWYQANRVQAEQTFELRGGWWKPFIIWQRLLQVRWTLAIS
mmetsp:Transcript_120587/g.276321  ORF Transcript_120587/g.276321 Transcript_120587/m.276321 type:complete len:106 (+) Transcript_120587:36-353(+)